MNTVKNKSHKAIFYAMSSFLVLLIISILFITFNIHGPYIKNQNRLIDIRNKIISQNNLIYDNYFNEYNRQKTVYVIKVKENNATKLEAYDSNLKRIDSYQGEIFDEKILLSQVKQKYKQDIETLKIGYEDNHFLYYGQFQTNSHLYYYYYSIDKGKFLKEYRL